MRARRIWALLAVSACGACRGKAASGAQVFPPVPVVAAPVANETIRDTSEYVGLLKARRSVLVQPQVDGHITRILVTSGRRVEAGTLLVQIDPSRARQAAAGQRAAHEAAVVARDYARQQLSRVERLYRGGAAAQQDLDQARTTWEKSEAEAASTEAAARVGGVELRYTSVVAPVAGVVGDIPVRVGDLVTTQTVVTTLDDNDTLEAYVNVPVERADAAKLGTLIEIIDERGDVVTESKVTFVSPRADPSTQMVLVKAAVDNGPGRLRSEQFVRARIVWGQHQGPVVPVLAVQTRAGQAFVWVVRVGPGGREVAEPRPVQLGPIQGQTYPVTSGLKVDERVVVSGVQKLRPGAAIALVPTASPQRRTGG